MIPTSIQIGEQTGNRRLHVFLWAFLTLLLLVLGWSTVYRVAWDDVTHTDYTVYYVAAKAALHAGNIYTVQNEHGWNYVYPPPFVLLVVPLTKLSLAWGSGIWYLLEIAAIAFASVMSVALLGPVVRDHHKAALYSLPLLYLSTLLVSGIMRCQASEFVIALVVATFYWHFRGRPVLAGLSLAAAAVIKVFPLTLLAYFVIRRQWRAVAATLGGMVLMLFLLPSLFWGWHQNNTYLNEWLEVVGRPALMSNTERATATPLYKQLMNTSKSRNQSLEALFLTVGTPPQNVQALVTATGGVMFLLMWLAERQVSSREDELLLCSAFIIWHLLIPPISETHYFGMLILSLTAVIGLFLYGDYDERTRRRGLYSLGIMMIAVMVLIGYSSTEILRPLCLACLLIWSGLLYRLLARANAGSAFTTVLVPSQDDDSPPVRRW